MCPRCGSKNTTALTLHYPDGPMKAEKCQDCTYLDVKGPPTGISPLTASASQGGRKDPVSGRVLPMAEQTMVV